MNGSGVFTLNRYKDQGVTDFIDNDGKITLSGDNSNYLLVSEHSLNMNPRLVMTNSKNGEINITGKNSQIYSSLSQNSIAFINNGKIEITGEESLGFSGASNLILNQPLTLNGKRILGVVGMVYDLPNVIKINMGEQSSRSAGLYNPISKNEKAKSQTDVDIRIRGEKNIGVLNTPIDSAVYIGKENNQNSRIVIEGGNNNAAIVTYPSSKVTVDAELSVTGGTNNSIAQADGGSIILKGDVKVGAENNYIQDSVVFHADKEKASISLQEGKKKEFYLQGKSTLAFASSAGTSLKNFGMDISGATAYFKDLHKDNVAIYATRSYVKADKVKLTVKGNGTAIASMSGSKISLQESTVDFTGNAYALYARSDAEIDISKSKIYLSNGAVGFDIDEKAKKQNIIMDNDTRIIPKTEDVIVFNLKRFKQIDTRNGIRENIIKVAERKLNEDGRNVNLTNLVEAKGKYKVAAIDGGKIIIGSLDKSGKIEDDINGLTGSAKKDGYQYYNLFQAQRLQAETVPGSTIRAVLTNEESKNFFDQVVALEMNSSGNAKSNNDTQINLKETKLIADRIDSGAGAIGMFINYGKISVDKKSTVDVETEQNIVNDRAIGAYAVNGSEVINEGTINVGGNSSAGIFSMSYRLGQDGKPLVDEFRKRGKFGQGQGMLKVTNKGTITVTGVRSVGINAVNNNPDLKPTLKEEAPAGSNKKKTPPVINDVINEGTISAQGTNSVGIFGERVNIQNEKGQISVGTEGIGIYAKSALLGKKTQLGTFTLMGKNGVGIYLSGAYEAGQTLAPESVMTVKSTGKESIGLFIDVENIPDFETDLQVNSEGEVISYYSKSSNIAVKQNVSVKEGGIGIAAADGKNIEYKGDGAKGQSLKVLSKGLGMYGSHNQVTLNGLLHILGQKGLGIYAQKESVVQIHQPIDFGPDVDSGTGVQAVEKSEVHVHIEGGGILRFFSEDNEQCGILLRRFYYSFL